MDKPKRILYLGALLHDIGKFWQRAKEDKRFEKHQLLTSMLVNQLLENEEIAFVALMHHKEDLDKSTEKGQRRVLAEINCEADNLASGERNARTGEEIKRLQSIFSSVWLDKPIDQKSYQPMSPLSIQRFKLPKRQFPSNAELRGDYLTQWDSFAQELGSFTSAQILQNPDLLLPLLKKYLWCMPSAYYRYEPDISLYDHLKVAGAIAVCLYDFLSTQFDLSNQTDVLKLRGIIGNQDEERFLLVCGDLSGIQKFIYRLSAKGAAKSLKGRSFYLQLMCDTIAQYLLDELNLPLANLLYSSGGRFYILAPKTAENQLQSLLDEVNKRLLEAYDGQLFLGLGWTGLRGKDFTEMDSQGHYLISQKWNQANQAVGETKRRRFVGLMVQGDFFRPFGEGGLVENCASCYKHICRKEKVKDLMDTEVFPVEEETDKVRCRTCETLKRLGEALAGAEVMVQVRNGDVQSIEGTNYFEPLGLGYRYFFSRAHTQTILNKLKLNDNSKVTLYTLKDSDFLKCRLNLPNVTYGFRFYGGNWTPKDNAGKTADFDDLATITPGFKRLGILRMDVDNLGRIFAEGLHGVKTISRLVSLSGMLDFFFNGFLNHVCEKHRNQLLVTYSGGDDLFLVGNWAAIPEIAQNIQQAFKEFTCQNPDLTLSGGIALIEPKLPLYKGADWAGEFEEQAKAHTRKRNGKEMSKDAITFLEKPLSWKDFEVAWEIKELLAECLHNGLNRGILDRLNRIYATYYYGKCKYWAKWLWRATYSLHRYATQNERFKNQIDALCAALVTSIWNDKQTEQKLIHFLDVPTRWAEFLTRK